MDNLLVCYKTSQIKSTRQQHIPTSFCCSCQNFTAFDVVGLQNCYSFCFGPGLLLPPPLSRLNLQWYTYNKQPFYIYVYPVIPTTYSEKEQHNTNISNPPPCPLGSQLGQCTVYSRSYTSSVFVYSSATQNNKLVR